MISYTHHTFLFVLASRLCIIIFSCSNINNRFVLYTAQQITKSMADKLKTSMGKCVQRLNVETEKEEDGNGFFELNETETNIPSFNNYE